MSPAPVLWPHFRPFLAPINWIFPSLQALGGSRGGQNWGFSGSRGVPGGPGAGIGKKSAKKLYLSNPLLASAHRILPFFALFCYFKHFLLFLLFLSIFELFSLFLSIFLYFKGFFCFRPIGPFRRDSQTSKINRKIRYILRSKYSLILSISLLSFLYV